MLSLRVNNSVLDLGDTISISWELRSPMFFDAGSRSYPFSFPSTLNNRRILGFRHRIEGINSIYDELPCAIVFNNIDLFHGILRFTIANKDHYEAVIYQREGDLNYMAQKMMLSDFNYGDLSFSSQVEAINWINHSIYDLEPKYWYYPYMHQGFPMIANENYFDPPTDFDDLRYFNYRAPGELNWYLALHADNPTPNPRRINIPFVFLRHALNTVIASLGYSFNDLLLSTHPDFNKLLIYNSLSNNSICTEFTYTMDKTFLNLHLPKILLLDFFSSIEKFFNARMFVQDLERTITLVGLDKIVDGIGDVINFDRGLISRSIELFDQDPILGFQYVINMDTADSHLKLWTDQSEYYNKWMKPPVDTISSLPAWPYSIPGDVRYVVENGKFYRFLLDKTWYQDANIAEVDIAHYYYKKYGDAISIPLSSLKCAYPAVGSSVMADCGNQLKDWNDIKFRILFMDHYPLPDITPIRYIPLGTDHTENFNLWMQGSNNMFDKFFKKTCDFYLYTKPVKVQRIMTLQEIKGLDFTRKYMMDSVKYLLRRVQLTFKKDRISPAMMECQTVN